MLCTFDFVADIVFSHNGAYTVNGLAAVVIDEWPITLCLSDVDSSATGSKWLDLSAGGWCYYRVGV